MKVLLDADVDPIAYSDIAATHSTRLHQEATRRW